MVLLRIPKYTVHQTEATSAVKAMLNLGALPEGYKRPDTAPKKDKDRKFRMDVDRKGRSKMIEIKD